jgi:type II secretory pathway pseudopilin PulG
MSDRNKTMRKRTRHQSGSGFSLVEMLIACALTTVIMGAIFAQIIQGQQNSTAEQAKLDLFQESREFMDQMARDLRASGYPNTRNFTTDPNTPAEQSPQEAIGLVKMDVGQLWFESSIDGSGNVSVIHYNLVTTGTNCPCLTRSQTPKITADPLTGQTETNQTEVQNVLNGSTSDPIFQAYFADGTAVSLPIDITNNAMANINSIFVTLKVQSPYPDPRTGQKPTMTLVSTVRLNNCSVAYPNTSGTVMGCK